MGRLAHNEALVEWMTRWVLRVWADRVTLSASIVEMLEGSLSLKAISNMGFRVEE